ncbi:glutamate racemase [Bdellovibrionota bacterium FG-1]
MKIGVFDSGVGGLTVLSELCRRFPDAEYVYLGDTANVPYGTKSTAQVERLSREGARNLRERGVQALVVACNTASSLALPAIVEEMAGIPVFGVVRPGAEALLNALASQGAETSVLILATSGTVRSHAYSHILRELLSSRAPKKILLPIIEQACPLLVPMIEEGWLDHPVLHQTIREYVGLHRAGHSEGIALLGCTHYPWIQPAIERALPGWKVINSASAVADALERANIVDSSESLIPGAQGRARVECLFTDPQAVPSFARGWIEALVGA